MVVFGFGYVSSPWVSIASSNQSLESEIERENWVGVAQMVHGTWPGVYKKRLCFGESHQTRFLLTVKLKEMFEHRLDCLYVRIDYEEEPLWNAVP